MSGEEIHILNDDQNSIGATARINPQSFMRERKRIIIIAVVVICLAGAIWFYEAHKIPQLSDSALTNLANAATNEASSKSALRIIDGQKKQTARTLSLRAEVYQNSGNYAKALALDKQYVQHYGDNYQTEENEGQLATMMGDKESAVAFYRQAIKLLSSDSKNATAPAEIRYVQHLIEKLQK
jgi:tetratricopeptide (TPR) repeat protein